MQNITDFTRRPDPLNSRAFGFGQYDLHEPWKLTTHNSHHHFSFHSIKSGPAFVPTVDRNHDFRTHEEKPVGSDPSGPAPVHKGQSTCRDVLSHTKKKALKRREISTRRNRRTIKMSMARCLPYSIKKGWRLG